MRKKMLALLAVLLLLLGGCTKTPQAAPTQTAADPGVVSAEVQVSGLPENGGELERIPLTLGLQNGKTALTAPQALLVWRFYDAAGEPVDLDSLPEPEIDALLGFEEAPADYGPVVQGNAAVIGLSLGELEADAAVELVLPLPGETAGTVRADLFVRDWQKGELRELYSRWWQYRESGAALPSWEDEPVLPELNSTRSLSWELRDRSAVLTGPGSWPSSFLYVPGTVRLSEVPALNVTILASRVAESDLYSQCGADYWLMRPDGSLITDRETLTQKNETVDRLLVINGRRFPRHVIRELEFPDVVLTTEDGTVLTAANVREIINANPCTEEEPLVLLVSPKNGTCLIEDPVAGTEYPVSVRGNAFAGCGTLRSVRFSPDCRTEYGEMLQGGVGMFSGCTALESVLGFPSGVVSMDGTFLNCVRLERAEGIPDTVKSMHDTFRGCTSLRSGPILPDSAEELLRCFADCTALETPPVIGAGARDLTETFRGCTALAEPPVLPRGILTMAGTFSDCTALRSAPGLPESVEELSYCFSGCTALGGEVTVPSRALTPTSLHELQYVFAACDGLEVIHLEYCGFRYYPQTLLRGIPVTANCTHLEDGLCPYCHYANLTTEIDGLEVVFDAVYEPYFNAAVDYLDNRVPDYLKNSCEKLTFTEDMDRYYQDFGLGLDVKDVGGFALSSNRFAWVRTYPNEEVGYIVGYVEHTITHELAHCYDFNVGSGSSRSRNGEWISIFREEGDKLGQYYGPAYADYPRSQRLTESYAIAVECYIHTPNELSRVCPGMYEYLRQTLPEEGD